MKLILLLVSAVTVSSLIASSEVKASGSNWVNTADASIKLSDIPVSNFDNAGLKNCKYEDAYVSTVSGPSLLRKVCSITGRSIDVGAYILSSGYQGFAVRDKSTSVFRPIVDLSTSNQTLRFFPDNDELVVYDKSYWRTPLIPYLSVYDNLADSLSVYEFNYLTNEPATYALEQSKTRTLLGLSNEQGDTTYMNVVEFIVSPNGRFVVANINYRAHVLIDLRTSLARIINNQVGNEYGGYSNPRLAAVSNDGRYVYVENLGRVFDTQNCGDDFKDNSNELNQSVYTMKKLCSSRNVLDLINSAVDYGFYGSNHVFENNDTILSFNVEYIYSGVGTPVRMDIEVKSKPKTAKLDYLALGDSYSSGEGDIGQQPNGASFYLPGTSSKGQCHLSTRSYPFLLSTDLHIADGHMKSVACSGAVVKHDYYGETTHYSGQAGRIKHESPSMQQTMKAEALENFTPGIVKQIDFVKSNKPSMVTLTGGGNDVGFAKILTYCALPSGIGDYSNTCEMALDNTKQRGILGDAIMSQYDQTVSLINAIKDASEDTKIYIIGYPSFASEDNNTCLNAAMLNSKERILINRSVSYLNSVLRQAAKFAGAHYIDTEDSLSGGRICEGSSYMTGPMNVLGFDIQDRKSEMFHPNYMGHEKMAKAIELAGITTEGDNPTPDTMLTVPNNSEYFKNSDHIPTFQDKMVNDGIAYAGKTLELTLSPGIFAADTIINFTIWSNEAKLGALRTDAQGGLENTLHLPDSVKPGYHLLLAEGSSSTGEPLRIYQFVEVKSSDTDTDGDGISDSDDKCEFIQTWYDERTGQEFCNITDLTKAVSSVSAKAFSQASVTNAKASDNNDLKPSIAFINGVNKGDQNNSDDSGSVLGINDQNNLVKASSEAKTSDRDDHRTESVIGLGALLLFVGIVISAHFVRKRFVKS